MIPLPNTIVIDFFEWLKDRFENGENQNEEALLELLTNDRYESRLTDYAYEYTHTRPFSRRFAENQEPDGIGRPFSAEHLAESTRRLFIHGKKSPSVDPTTAPDTSIILEINFLEWLLRNKNKPMNLQQMPTSEFTGLVAEYCDSAGKSGDESRKLIQAFKQTPVMELTRKLRAFLTSTQFREMKRLGYIYDRYSNRRIPYKCLFLPLAAEGQAFKSFIDTYWIDLNSLSEDSLDIYYSEEDFGKSGYEIRGNIKSIPRHLPGNLPCIVLWGEKMDQAKIIGIRGLSNEDILSLIASIVDWIKAKIPFDSIIERAEIMSKELVDRKRPVSNVVINVGSNTGVVAGAINDSHIETNVNASVDIRGFSEEAEEAIRLIRDHAEVSQEQKAALIEIINEARNAVDQGSEDGQKQSKEKFKYFILGAGKAVKDLASVLSSLVNVAKFFNIGIP